MHCSHEGCVPTTFHELIYLLGWNIPMYDEMELMRVTAECGRTAIELGSDSVKRARISLGFRDDGTKPYRRLYQQIMKAPVPGELVEGDMAGDYFLLADLAQDVVSNVGSSDKHDPSFSVMQALYAFYHQREEIEKIIDRSLDTAHFFSIEPAHILIALIGAGRTRSEREAEQEWAEAQTRRYRATTRVEWLKVTFSMSYTAYPHHGG